MDSIESGDILCLVTATYERTHDFFGGALVWRKLIDKRFDRTVSFQIGERHRRSKPKIGWKQPLDS